MSCYVEAANRDQYMAIKETLFLVRAAPRSRCKCSRWRESATIALTLSSAVLSSCTVLQRFGLPSLFKPWRVFSLRFCDSLQICLDIFAKNGIQLANSTRLLEISGAGAMQGASPQDSNISPHLSAFHQLAMRTRGMRGVGAVAESRGVISVCVPARFIRTHARMACMSIDALHASPSLLQDLWRRCWGDRRVPPCQEGGATVLAARGEMMQKRRDQVCTSIKKKKIGVATMRTSSLFRPPQLPLPLLGRRQLGGVHRQEEVLDDQR